jgi:hypothetical protein
MKDRPWLFHDKKQTDRLNYCGSVTHVRGDKIIQHECGKTRNLEILFNAYIVSIKFINKIKLFWLKELCRSLVVVLTFVFVHTNFSKTCEVGHIISWK